jgi:hypothetical protein
MGDWSNVNNGVFEAENNKELKYTLSIIVAKLQGLVGKK